MRKTEASGWMMRAPLKRAAWFSAVALSVGVMMASGPVRAADDEEEDDKTFEEKIIEGIMRGIGGTNMENRGIDYRERSPLVVPPKLNLPPPGQATEAKAPAPNWPKDPDEQRRKAAVEGLDKFKGVVEQSADRAQDYVHQASSKTADATQSAADQAQAAGAMPSSGAMVNPPGTTAAGPRAQRTEGEGRAATHTHPPTTHTHDHYHVTHHHRGGVLGEWEHRTHWHTHEHNHNALTHSHDYSQQDEEHEHSKEAHDHDHAHPTQSPA